MSDTTAILERLDKIDARLSTIEERLFVGNGHVGSAGSLGGSSRAAENEQRSGLDYHLGNSGLRCRRADRRASGQIGSAGCNRQAVKIQTWHDSCSAGRRFQPFRRCILHQSERVGWQFYIQGISAS